MNHLLTYLLFSKSILSQSLLSHGITACYCLKCLEIVIVIQVRLLGALYRPNISIFTYLLTYLRICVSTEIVHFSKIAHCFCLMVRVAASTRVLEYYSSSKLLE